MEIHGISNVQGPKQVQSVQSKSGEESAQVTEKSGVNAQQDVVDVGDVQSGTSVSATGDGIRVDLVNRIRAEIQAGTYDTEEKMEIALSRLLSSLEE